MKSWELILVQTTYSPGMDKAHRLAVTGANGEMKAALAPMASLEKGWNVHPDRNDTFSFRVRAVVHTSISKNPNKWLSDKQIEVPTAADQEWIVAPYEIYSCSSAWQLFE